MRNSPELEQLRRDKMIAKATADLIRMHDGMNSSVEEVRRMVAQYLAEAQRIQRLPKGDKGDRGERGLLGPEGRPGKDGKDGKDGFLPVKGKDYLTKGDEDLLVLRVLARIKTPKDGETPVVNYDKIIEEAVEKLKSDKKLNWRDIEGLENELSSYRNQMARKQAGQHGGGDTVVAGTNVTITALPNGTKEISATGGTSPLTTKGDLYGFSTVDARIPVGANGTVLTADSGEALGVKWAAVSGTGDVVGPASSTDNAIARYDLTTGKIIQNSGITLSDTNILGTASGALGITPAAGSNLNVSLSGAGDFAVNTNQLYVDTSTGNVGIGTAVPGSKLHVSGGGVIVNTVGGAGTSIGRHINLGSVTTPTDWRPYTGSTAAAIQMENSATEGFLLVPTVGAAVPRTQFITTGGFEIQVGATIGSSGTNALQILSSGNVGIGETAPSERLVVAGQGTGRMLVGDVGFGDGYTALSVNGVLSSTNYNLLGSPGQAHLWINRASGGNIHFREANVDQVTILSGGNVGIGTTNPLAKLDVASGAIFLSNSYYAGALPAVSVTPLTGEIRGGENAASSYGFLRLSAGSTVGEQSAIDIVGYNSLATDAQLIRLITSGNERMRVTQSGNVGIGTTAPGGSLDVRNANSVSTALQVGGGTVGTFLTMHGSASAGGLSSIYTNYFSSEGDLVLGTWTNRANQLYLKSNGNVGIGVTNPASKLTVHVATDANFHVGTDGTELIFGAYNDAVSAYAPMQMYASEFNLMSGNVGIGTTTPSGKLDVRDGNFVLTDADVAHGVTDFGDSTSAYARLSPLSGTAGGLGMWTWSDTGTDSAYRLMSILGSADPTDTVPAIDLRGYKKNGGDIQALGSLETVLQISNAATPALTVLGSGNVGIGTTSPSALLTLGTAGTTAGTFSLAGGTSGVITLQTAAAAGTYTLTLPTTDGNASEFLQTDGSGVLTWAVPAGTGANTALSNLASVAINTSLVSDTDNTDDLGSSGVGWRTGYFATSVYTPIVRAQGSGGVEIKNSSGTDTIITGAGGGTGTSIVGTTNIASSSADYHQVAGGTGTITDTATGSSTDININLVPKGTGRLQAAGVNVPTVSSTDTITNKRNTRRLTTTNAPGATPTTNTDNVDIMNFTGLNTAITSMTTNLSGTPVDGDLVEFRFTDNGTARAITWGASFGATTVALPTTTVISTMLRVLFEWNGSIWQCVAVA